MREPFFSASVWTVTFSAPRVSTFSSVSRKPATLSPGSPAIRSMFTEKPPAART